MATFTSGSGIELTEGEWQIDIYSSGGAGTAALTYAADGSNYRSVDVSAEYSGTGSGGFTIKVGKAARGDTVPKWKMTLGGDAVASYFKIS